MDHGKLAVLDLGEPGRQIGEKLFILLDAEQQRELTHYVLTRNANSHFPRPAGPHFPARQGHIKRPVLESGTGVQGREGLHPASL